MRGFVGDIDERMRCTTRHAYNLRCSRFEAPTNYLEQVASFKNPKDLCFSVPMERRTKPRRVRCLYHGEGVS